MELSGLIFVALALVWAVVLIPQALRHHDENARTRSVEDVSDDVRVLRGETLRTPAAVPGATTEPRRRPATATAAAAAMATAAATITPTTGPDTGDDPWARVRSRLEASRESAKAAARRRRRILATLVLIAAGGGAAAALGVLPMWAPAIPAAVVLVFLVLARITVRRERARWRHELAVLRERAEAAGRARVERGGRVEEPAAPVHIPSQPRPREVAAASVDVLEPSVGAVAPARETAVLEHDPLEPAVGGAAPAHGSLWDPLPMTLPTYVGKPRAPRSVRTIDLSDPGVSSSGRDAAASALVAEAASAPAVDTDEDATQRAVGS